MRNRMAESKMITSNRVASRKSIFLIVALLLIFSTATFYFVPSLLLTGNSVSLTGASISILNSGNGSQCGGINVNTTLTVNVTSTGTCYTINASSIVLDCNNFYIEYGTLAIGYGIDNSANFENVTIQRCQIIERNSSLPNKDAIYNSNGVGKGILNSTITTSGNSSDGVVNNNSGGATISLTVITTSGSNAHGINLQNAPSGNIAANNITASGEGSNGIYLQGTSDNNIISDTNITTGGAFTILDDTLASADNNLVYRNAFAVINWTGNISTNISLLSDVGIFLQYNLLGLLESVQTPNPNASVQIEFLTLNHTTTPQLLHRGVRCDTTVLCNISSYDASSGRLRARVSSFSNYTTREGTPPAVTILNPSSSYFNFSSEIVSFNATVTDGNSSVDTVLFTFDNTTNTTSVFNITATNVSGNWNAVLNTSRVADGSNRMTVIANDSNNNINGTVFVYFIVDRGAPAVSFLLTNTSSNNNSNFTRGGTLQINTTLNDSLTTVQVVRFGIFNPSNNSEFNITTTKSGYQWFSNLSLGTLSDAVYTIRAYGNDTLSNLNDTIANITFRVDGTPPNVTTFGMNISNTGTQASGSIQFNVSINDSITSIDTVRFGFTSSTNASQFNATAVRNNSIYHLTLQLNTMGDATYTVSVYANDTLGNLNNSVSNLSFTIGATEGGGISDGGGIGGASSAGTAAGAAEGGVECNIDTDCALNEYCEQHRCRQYQCTQNSDCREGYYCVEHLCSRVFDLKIVDLTVDQGEISFTYSMKNILQDEGDAIMHFALLNPEGAMVSSGSDVIFVGAEEIVETAKLFFTSTIAPGEYRLQITLTFNMYEVASYRTFPISVAEIVLAPEVLSESASLPAGTSNLFGQAAGLPSFISDLAGKYFMLALVACFLVIGGGIMALKAKSRKSSLEVLEEWIATALAQGYSAQKIHPLLLENEWSELEIHLALERVQAAQQLQQAYALSSSQLHKIKKMVQKSKRQGIPQEELVARFVQQGWEEKIAAQFVRGYYLR